MKQFFRSSRRYQLWTGLLCCAFMLGAVCLPAQSSADQFFSQIYQQEPDRWFDLSDENAGRFKEDISGGQYITKQSFLLVDPYASGKERYLRPLEAKDLKAHLPNTSFFYGELSCNFEFNGGKLPFVGYTNGKAAGLIVHPQYDIIDAPTQALLASASLKRQGQMENYVGGLAQLFALIRLKQGECNPEILEFGKPVTTWTGEELNMRLPYDLKCKADGSNDWGPKTHYLDLDFTFLGGELTDITVIQWP